MFSYVMIFNGSVSRNLNYEIKIQLMFIRYRYHRGNEN